MTRLIATLALVALVAAGCGDKEDDVVSKDDFAQARAAIEDLAARVGPSTVDKDDLTDCVPGDDSSGKRMIYHLRVETADGVLDLLQGDVATDLEADGWTVRNDPPTAGTESVRFLKGDVAMGATIFPDRGYTLVSGSGGCVTE